MSEEIKGKGEGEEAEEKITQLGATLLTLRIKSELKVLSSVLSVIGKRANKGYAPAALLVQEVEKRTGAILGVLGVSESEDSEDQIEALVAQATGKIEVADLAPIVDESLRTEATLINADGLASQIEYLVSSHGLERAQQHVTAAVRKKGG